MLLFAEQTAKLFQGQLNGLAYRGDSGSFLTCNLGIVHILHKHKDSLALQRSEFCNCTVETTVFLLTNNFISERIEGVTRRIILDIFKRNITAVIILVFVQPVFLAVEVAELFVDLV